MKGMYTKIKEVPYEIVSDIFINYVEKPTASVVIMSLITGKIEVKNLFQMKFHRLYHSKGEMGFDH